MYNYLGKGMEYMPSAASLAASHKGKLKNLRLKSLHDHHGDTRACILSFEKHAKHHDSSMKKSIGIEGKVAIGRHEVLKVLCRRSHGKL